jgi:UDP-N-acetylmuramate dehydrogenase
MSAEALPLTAVTADAPLRALNTFGIDARARRLITLDDPAQLDRVLAVASECAQDAGVPGPLVLGGGSNLLIASPVVERPVIRMALVGRRVLGAAPDGSIIVEAGAGEAWDPFVRWTLAQRLAGLENLALIPGTVGAAPIQNIGAYGVEMHEHFDSLDAVHLASGRRKRFDASDCAFGYRDSVFKHGDGRGWMVLAVRFRLTEQPDAGAAAAHGGRRLAALRLDYGELRDELAARRIAKPTAGDVAEAVSAIRRRKLPDPAAIGNAGSFFKNPVVDPAAAAALQAREPGLPAWRAPDGVKLAAAWLIERCGWKGRRLGDAGVHERHALVLVNHGHASGEEILALACSIQASVAERFGVHLEPEPVIIQA